jgi:hypothetical protein
MAPALPAAADASARKSLTAKLSRYALLATGASMPVQVTRFSDSSIRNLVSTVNEFLERSSLEMPDVRIQFLTTSIAGQTGTFIALITHQKPQG